MDKADLIGSTMDQRPWEEAEFIVEFGAFVGYTSVRLASRVVRTSARHCLLQSVSLEVDNVHQVVARHFLDISALSIRAEVWSGQVRDLIPRVADELGARSCAFAFLDHRGTRFHEDFAHLVQVGSPGAMAQVVADNVLNPGGPVFAWNFRGVEHAVEWTLTEYMSVDKEDWMAVIDAPRHQPYQ